MITKELAEKVLAIVDAGLVKGLGEPIPGAMCIEAAVCYALGETHSDHPSCVGSAVRAFKIRLNDSQWSSDAARTAGLRKLGIAQLGSDQIDQVVFARRVAELTIRRIVPVALRARAQKNPAHAENLELAAKRCEDEGSHAAADAAATAATAAYAAYAAADAAAAAYADAAERDRVLTISANLALEVLAELNSPGCAWLDLCEVNR